MTADAFVLYDVFGDQLGAEGHNLNATDVIKMALLDSGYTPAQTTDVTFTVIDADELATANGYTAGGVTIAATWDAASGTWTFDTANASWTASGGAITARYAVLYNSSAGGTNDLIGYCLLDNTPADVTAADGIDFKVNIHASGVFAIS